MVLKVKLIGAAARAVRMGCPLRPGDPVPPKVLASILFYTHRPAKLNTMPPGERERTAGRPPERTPQGTTGGHPEPTAERPPEPTAERPADHRPPGDPARALATDPTLDHAAIAVRSFDEAIPLLEQLSGAVATRPERVESQGVEVCFVGNVELIRPLDPGSGVARFIDRRGPALHHVAYRVGDLESAMEVLTAQGFRFTSEAPMTGARGHRIAFMHPHTTGGVLVELVEKR